MSRRYVVVVSVLLLVACEESVEGPWAELGVPFAELEVDRCSESTLVLRYDANAQSEAVVLERLGRELTSAGWFDVSPDEHSIQFARTASERQIAVDPGHGVLHLSWTPPWPDTALRIELAQRTTEQKRAVVRAFYRQLETALRRAEEPTPPRCDDERLRELVPSSYAHRLPRFSPVSSLGGVIGAQWVRDLEGLEDHGLDQAWLTARETEEAGAILLFIEGGSREANTAVEADQFAGGAAGSRFVVAELASGEPLCQGGFAAFSSEEVEVRRGAAQEGLDADLSRNASLSIERSLERISSYLRYGS